MEGRPDTFLGLREFAAAVKYRLHRSPTMSNRVDSKVPIDRHRRRDGADPTKARRATSASARPAATPCVAPTSAHPVTAVQSEYSILWTRDYEKDTIPVVRELGIGYVAYYALGARFSRQRVEEFFRTGKKKRNGAARVFTR